MNALNRVVRRGATAPLRMWHSTARWRKPCCRFFPSCAEYGIEAIETHGVIRGSWLSLRRVSRCHPWGGYGMDPVPEPKSTRKAA